MRATGPRKARPDDRLGTQTRGSRSDVRFPDFGFAKGARAEVTAGMTSLRLVQPKSFRLQLHAPHAPRAGTLEPPGYSSYGVTWRMLGMPVNNLLLQYS
jgi:hypothetical protein